MNEAQILSWFWESSSKQGWLCSAMDIPSPIPTLRQSLRALAVTRYGRFKGDEQWMRQGRRLYGEALSTLQKTLRGQPFHDETLASARALVLYEFLESTSENPNAWETHLSGLARLMEVRGKPQSAMAKAVFADVRYPLMAKALMRGEMSPFSEEGWLLDEKCEQLWNYGFQIAAIMAASEKEEDVRKDLVELYQQVEKAQDPATIYRGTFQLLLLLMMERFGLPPLGNQELVARGILRTLKRDIGGKEGFRPARMMLPVNTLIWFYRRRPEIEQCLRLKQALSDSGYLFARDVNKGRLAVVNGLQDGDAQSDRPRRCHSGLALH